MPLDEGGYLIAVNETGFRCRHSFIQEKTSAKQRILLFGDSFTAGDCVSNHARYGDVIETLLPNVEIFNFGLPGSGTDQHYLIYKEYAQNIERDLVIIAVLVENIRRVNARFRYAFDGQRKIHILAKPYFELCKGELVLHHHPVPREPIAEESLSQEDRTKVDRGGRLETARKVISALGLRDIAQKVLNYQPLPEYDSPDTPQWLLMAAILEKWISGIQGPVLLMPIPLYNYVEEISDPEPYRARFRELSLSLGCHLHDPLNDLAAYPMAERKTFRFKNNPHLTVSGHSALAKSLAPVISRILDMQPA